jgi:hypothetical protein
VPALVRQLCGRQGPLVFDPLINFDDAGILQTSELRRQIASREFRGTLQKEEVGLFARREHCEDREPRRLMDNAINFRHLEVALVFIHGSAP